jgi:hypothetical protein
MGLSQVSVGDKGLGERERGGGSDPTVGPYRLDHLPRLILLFELEEGVRNSGSGVDAHLAPVVHRPLETVESVGRLSGLPPLLRRQQEDRRTRYVTGHVCLYQGFKPPGQVFVIVGQKGLLKQSIKLLTCHMRHIARVPSGARFRPDNGRYWSHDLR